MGFLNRLIRQEIQGASPKTVKMEEEMEAAEAEQAALAAEGYAIDPMTGYPIDMGGYTGGRPLAPMPPMPLPPNLDHETMKIYLQPKTPEKKGDLRGRERYWIYSDEVCTSILTSNLDSKSQKRIEIILRQAKDLDGCDNVDNLIHDLQNEVWMLVISNKARSDLPDHIRERIVPSMAMSLYGESNMQKSTGERPKENRAIAGIVGKFTGR